MAALHLLTHLSPVAHLNVVCNHHPVLREHRHTRTGRAARLASTPQRTQGRPASHPQAEPPDAASASGLTHCTPASKEHASRGSELVRPSQPCRDPAKGAQAHCRRGCTHGHARGGWCVRYSDQAGGVRACRARDAMHGNPGARGALVPPRNDSVTTPIRAKLLPRQAPAAPVVQARVTMVRACMALN